MLSNILIVFLLCDVYRASATCSNVSISVFSALRDLYESTSGENWQWNRNTTDKVWAFEGPYSDPCLDNWQGITCTTASDRECRIEKLELSYYQLQGPLPSTLNNFRDLSLLNLAFNNLNSTIPATLFSISRLTSINMSTNQLAGRIPPVSAMKMNLKLFDISTNKFTGPLPSDFSTLSNMQYLRLRLNKLSGALDAIGEFTELSYINVRSNHFTGSLPSSLLKLAKLSFFVVAYNSLTGTVPSNIGSLSKIGFMQIHGNRFTGRIPSSVGQWINYSTVLYFSDNFFTGTIPQSLENLSSLQGLWVQNNRLTGTLPQNILIKPAFEYFLGQNNKFHGNINALLNAESAKNAKLEIFDGRLLIIKYLKYFLYIKISSLFFSLVIFLFVVSLNRLTGTFPADFIATSESIQIFAINRNCIAGAISDVICRSQSIQKLIANGLSLSCSAHSQMTGTIPPCLFNIASMKALHLSANNLKGTLPTNILTLSTALVNLSISYNAMTGTLPLRVMQTKFSILDIAKNKFTGLLGNGIINNRSELVIKIGDGDPAFGIIDKSQLEMSVNRFSGSVPSSTANQYDGTVNILTGSLFDCKDSLPESDVTKSFYVCGSSELDEALYFLLATCIMGLVYFSCVNLKRFRSMCSRKAVTENAESIHNEKFNIQNITEIYFEKVNKWHSSLHLVPQECVNTRSFIRSLKMIKMLSNVSVIFIVLMSIIIFPSLKTSHENATHYVQYNWFVSIALLRGYVSASILLIYWMLSVTLVVAFVYYNHSLLRAEQHERYRRENSKTKSLIEHFHKHKKALGFIILDLSIVLLVNVAYVIAKITIERQFIVEVQLSIAIFKLSWNIQVVGFLILWYSVGTTTNSLSSMRLRLFILVLNTVIAPMLATLFSDRRCFYDIIFPPPALVTEYSYPYCSTARPDFSCAKYTQLITTFSTAPPFQYSSQCTSALVMNFVPIVMYVYIIISLAVPTIFFLATVVPAKSVPDFILQCAPGMLWPQEVLNGNCKYIIRADNLMVSQVLHMCVLLTFGLASPALATAAGLVVLSEVYFNELFLGRYLLSLKESQGPSFSPESLVCLEASCANIWRCPKNCIWIVVTVSALYFGLASFDIASDTIGTEVGFVFAIIAILYVVGLWQLAKQKYLENVLSHKSFEFLWLIPSFIGDSTNTLSTSRTSDAKIELTEGAPADDLEGAIGNPITIGRLKQISNDTPMVGLVEAGDQAIPSDE